MIDPGTGRDGPREAATVVLLRERNGRPDYEVYLVRRPRRAGFMPDSHVFPGGKVEAADADPRLGSDAARSAAVREAFEECGVLLCVDSAGRAPRTAEARLTAHRQALQAGRATLADVLAAEGLRIAADRIWPWGHWITPSGEPVRFSARFFVARVPPGQDAAHAAGELVEDLWATPGDVLERERAGELRLPPPTFFTVTELAALPELAAIERAAAGRRVVTVMPKLLEREGSTLILLPWDPEYAAAPGEGVPLPERFAPPHWSRHVLEHGHWWRR